jgi:hypothetical protein
LSLFYHLPQFLSTQGLRPHPPIFGAIKALVPKTMFLLENFSWSSGTDRDKKVSKLVTVRQRQNGNSTLQKEV